MSEPEFPRDEPLPKGLGSPQHPSSSAELARMSMGAPASSRRLAPTVPGFVLPVEEGGGPLTTLIATLYALGRIERGAVSTQIYQLGVRSLPFLCLVLAFVGSIIVYQAGIQTLRIVPDTSALGATYLELLVRELAASLTAMMLATRVGAGIAAELGSMRVTDQLDALRLSRTDPVVYLVAPRLVACVVLTPIVTIIAGAVALVSGTITGLLAFGISPTTFLDARYVDLGTLATGLLKSLAFGVAVPVISAHAGLYTRGGSQGVGDATTRAVVGSSLAVIVLGFLIGAAAHVLFGTGHG
jgi:phospholipid/cholesterol/gamma-HCH transport system permease protein